MNVDTFTAQLRERQNPVIVELWASWCLPCRRMAPTLEALAQTYQGQVDLWKISADEQPDLARGLGVLGIPTLIGYRDGQEIFRHTGSLSPGELEALFQAAGTGSGPVPNPLSRSERLFRAMAGLAVLAVAWYSGPSWILGIAGGLVLFSAVYDRCPAWKVLSSLVAEGLRGRL